MPRLTSRTLSASAAVALSMALLAPVPAASAATASTGYVRVAHLSPDTLEVDVTLSALSGGTVLYSLSDVGYGGVSNYMPLEPGTYAIAMRPAGADPTSTPVVEASIDVTADAAATVIAMGPNSDLETTVVDDDLSAPPADSSRVRVFQASVTADTVDIRTEDGTELAAGARFGDVGEYVDLPSGPTDFSLVSDGTTEDIASADLAAGTAQTLFVLDDANGALTVVPAVDSAAVTQAPIGGVETGGGALATADQGIRLGIFGGAAGLAALLLAAAGIRARRDTPAAHVTAGALTRGGDGR